MTGRFRRLCGACRYATAGWGNTSTGSEDSPAITVRGAPGTTGSIASISWMKAGPGKRWRKDKALRRTDAVVAQVDDLLEILHALGDDLHPQIAREIHQRLDDRLRMRLGADRIDEHLVDLDDVDAELEDIG